MKRNQSAGLIAAALLIAVSIWGCASAARFDRKPAQASPYGGSAGDRSVDETPQVVLLPNDPESRLEFFDSDRVRSPKFDGGSPVSLKDLSTTLFYQRTGHPYFNPSLTFNEMKKSAALGNGKMNGTVPDDATPIPPNAACVNADGHSKDAKLGPALALFAIRYFGELIISDDRSWSTGAYSATWRGWRLPGGARTQYVNSYLDHQYYFFDPLHDSPSRQSEISKYRDIHLRSHIAATGSATENKALQSLRDTGESVLLAIGLPERVSLRETPAISDLNLLSVAFGYSSPEQKNTYFITFHTVSSDKAHEKRTTYWIGPCAK